LTAEEVKSENEASQDSLLDKGKEVEFTLNKGGFDRCWKY